MRGYAYRGKIMEQRFCKKCLLRDMDEDAYFLDLQSYISHLGEEVKVPEEEYERRLAVCSGCDWLLNGMCRKCGCFVELRAVMKKNHCADSDKNW